MNNQDYGYKDLFSHREIVHDLMNHFFNEKWFRGIEMTSLEKVNSHYISGKYQQRESDIVWKMKYKGEWLYLYLLLEFQSSIDRYMSIRLMSYIGLLYEDLIKSKSLSKKGKLPAILPWVIYTGKAAWSAPLDSCSLLEKAVPIGMKKYFPTFSYHILDIGQCPLIEGCYSNNLMLPLIELEQKVLNWDQAKVVIEKLALQLKEPEYDSLRRAFARYAVRVLKLREMGIKEDVEKINLEEVRSMLAERIEAYKTSLVEQGMEQGRDETSKTIARELLKKGLDPLFVSEITHIPSDKLKTLD